MDRGTVPTMFLITLLLFAPIAWYLYECKLFLGDLARIAPQRPLQISSPEGQRVLLRYIFGRNKVREEGHLERRLIRLRILLAANAVLLALWFFLILAGQ